MANSAPQLAWVGLGNMGRGLAFNLASRGPLNGKPLIVYNRTASRFDDLRSSLAPSDQARVLLAASAEAAAKDADIIFTSFGDDQSVLDMYEKLLGGCNGKVEGKLFTETSTVMPETAEKLARKVQEAGGMYVAMPIFGPPAMAKAGTVVVVLAGPASAVARLKPYTDGVISRMTIDLSDEPVGKAALLKIAGNTFILSMVETLAEGLVFAEKTGLGTTNLHKFIECVMGGPFTAYSKRMTEGAYMTDDPLFSVPLATKDAMHAINLASSSGAPGILKVTQAIVDHMKKVPEVSGKKAKAADFTAVYGVVRTEAGLEFDNGSSKE